MAEKKVSSIYGEEIKDEHIIINGVPLPDWLKMSDKQRDAVRKKNK